MAGKVVFPHHQAYQAFPRQLGHDQKHPFREEVY